jgi:nuclear pore complex protein Nup155
MSIPSDSVNMLKIVGTPQGRIFMCGRDGNLYELQYQVPISLDLSLLRGG